MNELTSNGIHIYQCPTDDETVADVNTAMNVSLLTSIACCLNLRGETRVQLQSWHVSWHVMMPSCG